MSYEITIREPKPSWLLPRLCGIQFPVPAYGRLAVRVRPGSVASGKRAVMQECIDEAGRGLAPGTLTALRPDRHGFTKAGPAFTAARKILEASRGQVAAEVGVKRNPYFAVNRSTIPAIMDAVRDGGCDPAEILEFRYIPGRDCAHASCAARRQRQRRVATPDAAPF